MCQMGNIEVSWRRTPRSSARNEGLEMPLCGIKNLMLTWLLPFLPSIITINVCAVATAGLSERSILRFENVASSSDVPSLSTLLRSQWYSILSSYYSIHAGLVSQVHPLCCQICSLNDCNCMPAGILLVHNPCNIFSYYSILNVICLNGFSG